MRNFMTIMEDAFQSKSQFGSGYVGLTYQELWETIRQDSVEGSPRMHPILAEARSGADVVLEFDKAKLLRGSVSLQPSLTAIHVNIGSLNRYLEEKELDAIFLSEGERETSEMMIWFLRTSPMIKSLP